MTEHPAPKPAEPPKDLPPGQYGVYLKEIGINSTRLPDQVGGVETIEVSVKDLEQSLKRLRYDDETGLNCLACLSGVESPDSFDAVYHLWSYFDAGKELVVKVKVPKADVRANQLPVVPSITPFWQAADWHERETYDLMGIKFAGHPYLRRILNPWDWEGHPLRRDYKQPVDSLNDRNPHSMR
jgi:NADH-quinone oxidoreductase subunit C